jgi:hypothetical protein
MMALSRRQVAVEHQLRHADHGGHRRSDLVTDEGEEIGFRLAGLFGGVLRHQQKTLGAFRLLAQALDVAEAETDGKITFHVSGFTFHVVSPFCA